MKHTLEQGEELSSPHTHFSFLTWILNYALQSGMGLKRRHWCSSHELLKFLVLETLIWEKGKEYYNLVRFTLSEEKFPSPVSIPRFLCGFTESATGMWLGEVLTLLHAV